MRIKIILIFILTLAFFFRIWQLNILPFGFTPDEASFGYDAYSIIKTGNDQWGHFLPLTLESFGDFKLPLYTYLAIPSVSIFGLNVFSTRLPNAILGTLAVFVTYLMVREFSKITNNKHFLASGDLPLEILSSLLLAVSPWHIMMSRGAFEANLTTFLMPLGVYFFIKSLNSLTTNYLVLAAISFGLNLFSYHSARLVTPTIVVLLVIIFKTELMKKRSFVKTLRDYSVPVFIFGIFLFAAIYTLSIGGARRAQDISILSGAVETASDNRFAYLFQGVSVNTARIFVNKYQVLAGRFFENYFQYFSPKFLFLDGPAEGTYGMLPGRGVLYWFEFIFIIYFFYGLTKVSDKRLHLFLFFWILTAAVPAALTMGRGYSANRAVVMLPALSIMSAIGLFDLLTYLRNKINSKVQFLVCSLLFLFSVFSFSLEYFIVSPFKNSKDMLWGNIEVSNWLIANSVDKKEVIVSRSLSEPHIYVAFANAWDPADYQEQSKQWSIYRSEGLKFVDQLNDYSLGKYTFTSIDYKRQSLSKEILIVGRPGEFPLEVKPVSYFVAPDGEISVQVVEPFSELYAQLQYVK